MIIGQPGNSEVSILSAILSVIPPHTSSSPCASIDFLLKFKVMTKVVEIEKTFLSTIQGAQVDLQNDKSFEEGEE